MVASGLGEILGLREWELFQARRFRLVTRSLYDIVGAGVGFLTARVSGICNGIIRTHFSLSDRLPFWKISEKV